MPTRLKIDGMNCGHCAAKVQDALERIPGVDKATVTLEDQSATVDVSGDVPQDAFQAAVTEAGYQFVGVE
jgi:P-type Cu+ transporter